jgi:glycosyltransferase involved in cell wall biosynthesis
MLRQMPRDICAMDVCCKGPRLGLLADEARSAGAEVIHCPMGPTLLPFARRLAKILREGEYDVLHCHLGAHSGIPVLVARLTGVPVVTMFHSTAFPPQTWTRAPILRQMRAAYAKLSVSFSMRHSRVVTACSQAVLESHYGVGHVPAEAAPLYLGVRTPPPASEQARREFRQSMGWSDDTPIVIHVGRFDEPKNHPGLFEAFTHVARVRADARFVLLGDGPLRPQIERLASAPELAGRVSLLGLRDDVPRILGLADVFVFPSIREGFPVAALEAAAAGLPIVGSRIPSIAEAVEDGHTGLLHEVTDTQGMARSVIGLLNDRSQAAALGRAGRERIVRHFSLEAGARRLLEVYRECVPPQRRGPSPALGSTTARGGVS